MVKTTKLNFEYRVLSRIFITLLLFIGSFNECLSQSTKQDEVTEKKAILPLNETTPKQKKIIDDFLKIKPNQSCADISFLRCSLVRGISRKYDFSIGAKDSIWSQ